MRRYLNGPGISISISVIVSLIFSFIKGNGKYYAVTPAFAQKFNSEVMAVLISFLCCAVMGEIIVYTSLSIYGEGKQPTTVKTVLHFMIVMCMVFGFGYYLCWFDLSSIIQMFTVFIIIYVIIWTVSYLTARNEINKINEKFEK